MTEMASCGLELSLMGLVKLGMKDLTFQSL